MPVITPSLVQFGVSSNVNASGGNFTAGMNFWVIADKTVIGIKFFAKFAGGGTKDIKFRLYQPGGALLATTTVLGVVSGSVVRAIFAVPVALSGVANAATPGVLYGVSAYYTDGTVYGPPLGTFNGFPGPSQSAGQSTAAGAWLLPDMAFSTFAFAAGDATPNNNIAGEHYPIEPIFQ